MLCNFGFINIVMVNNGVEVVEYCEFNYVDVIFMDM